MEKPFDWFCEIHQMQDNERNKAARGKSLCLEE